jgi:hypothetical protein
MIAAHGGCEHTSLEQLIGQPDHGIGHAGATCLLTIHACLPTCRSRLNP